MSTPGRSALNVVICVEQLRRAVPGGIGTYTAGLLRGLGDLAPAEHPHVGLFASASRERPDPLERFGLSIASSHLPSPVLTRAWDLGLRPVGRAHDIVHSVSLASPPTPGLLVVTVHDLAWRSAPETISARARDWHEAALRRVGKHARRIVVPSAEIADAVTAAGVGIARERVVVIDEGSDHLPAPDDAATDALLTRSGVMGEFLLAVGTLEPRKNLARLVAAYAAMSAELPEPWPLVIVGPNGWGPALGDVPLGVVIAGQVPDAVLSGLYGRARCLCYVPLVEGFGLPVVEAMRAMIPVVSSGVPAAGGATLLVDPFDPASIAEGMMRASTDEACRTALVGRGAQRVLPLTWQATARAHVETWCDVMSMR